MDHNKTINQRHWGQYLLSSSRHQAIRYEGAELIDVECGKFDKLVHDLALGIDEPSPIQAARDELLEPGLFAKHVDELFSSWRYLWERGDVVARSKTYTPMTQTIKQLSRPSSCSC